MKHHLIKWLLQLKKNWWQSDSQVKIIIILSYVRKISRSNKNLPSLFKNCYYEIALLFKVACNSAKFLTPDWYLALEISGVLTYTHEARNLLLSMLHKQLLYGYNSVHSSSYFWLLVCVFVFPSSRHIGSLLCILQLPFVYGDGFDCYEAVLYVESCIPPQIGGSVGWVLPIEYTTVKILNKNIITHLFFVNT